LQIELSDAVLSDLDLLVGFVRELYAHEEIVFDEGRIRGALSGLIGDPSLGGAYLIKRDGRAIGYLILTYGYSIEFGGRDAFVDELFVGESDRGHGAGTVALNFIRNLCALHGIRAVHLEVDNRNDRANSLYRRLGFFDHERHLMTLRPGDSSPEGPA
jgi:GNAT superfamily N-acetyltransferase